MTGLNYPLIFECRGCGGKTTVRRVDAKKLHHNPDLSGAVETVLRLRGWTRVPIKRGSCCPECAKVAD